MTPRVFNRFVIPAILAAVACVPVTLGAAGARADDAAARFTALAIVQGGPGAAVPVTIVINKWSSDADRDRLLTTLTEQGSKKLLDALSDMPQIGSIASPGSVGIQIRFARQSTLPGGGQHITLLTDRPMGFLEAANMGRSTDYPFAAIDLKILPDGSGSGTASLATKISLDRDTNTIVLENYTIQPVQLTGVKRLGGDSKKAK
jgi:hypothetical protein